MGQDILVESCRCDTKIDSNQNSIENKPVAETPMECSDVSIPNAESLQMEGNISIQEGIINLFGKWLFNNEPMGQFTYSTEIPYLSLENFFKAETVLWNGSFTMINPLFGTTRKKKNVKKVLTILERFQISKSNSSSQQQWEGVGKNRFGKFSIAVSIEGCVFSGTKTYLPRNEFTNSPKELEINEGLIRTSKRQRVPKRVLVLDTSQQNYGFIVRGSGTYTSDANGHGYYSFQDDSGGNASPPVSVCSAEYMNFSPEERDKLIKHPHLIDLLPVYSMPFDPDRAAAIRKVAKRRTCMLIRQLVKDRNDVKSFRSSTPSASSGSLQNRRASVTLARKKTKEHTENWINAQLYRGTLVDGKRNGFGICAFENGIVYEGSWSNGKMHGKGSLFNRMNEVIFQGDFVDHAISGRGSYCFENGDRYDGEFKDNTFHGYGTYFFAEKRYTYYGEWRQGQRYGFGTLTNPTGSCYYDGEWQKDKWCGRGRLYLENTVDYEGCFKDNLFEGRGLCQYANQSTFEGTFKCGQKDGRGTYKFPNGATYEGRFRCDRGEGFGTLLVENEKAIRIAIDEFMLPIKVQSEIKYIHRAAGFGENGK